jgi:hypothetical protein
MKPLLLAAAAALGTVVMTQPPQTSTQTWKPATKAWEGTAGGESALVTGEHDDFDARTDVTLKKGAVLTLAFRAAFRDDQPTAYAGRFVMLDEAADTVTLGDRSDDGNVVIISRRNWPVIPDRPHRLRVIAQGSRVRVFFDAIHAMPKQPWPKMDVDIPCSPTGRLAFIVASGSVRAEKIAIARPKSEVPAGRAYSNRGGLVPDCADPGVLFDKDTYYLYGTGGRGIRVYTSKDLVHWSAATGATNGYALVPEDSWGQRWWWAPEVIKVGDRYVMNYSVQERLAVAFSRSPLGPFVNDPKKPFHENLGEIDSHVFTDDDGKRYLFFVRFNQGNRIAVAELNPDLKSVKDETFKEILKQSQPWERDPVVEGPWVLKHKGTYYLMYSGDGYTSPGYGVGYATAPSPYGPWTKWAHNPILQNTSEVHGPGHHSIAPSPDGKEMFIVYHTHFAPGRVQPRKVAIDRIRFAPNPEGGPDILEVYGPTLTPQPMPSGARGIQEKSE